MAAGVGLGVAAIALAVAVSSPGSPGPTGDVLGEQGLPGAASTPPEAGLDDGPRAMAATTIVETSAAAPVWQDVLGAWRGQALFAVRNEGAQPLEISLADSRFTVRDGDTDVAAGRFEAALPPVLEPGETGYLVGRFILPSAPSGPLSPASRLDAVPAAGRLVTLAVDDVRVAEDGGTVSATGKVRNASDDRAVDGAVGVVLLAADGQPLAALVDAASTAVLEEGEVAEFHATYPPAPSPEDGSVARTVAIGWAWDRRVASP